MDATLADLVDELDRILAAPTTAMRWRADTAERVQTFRDAWARYHVSSDHEGGIYHDLAESEPRVTPLVRRLRSESLQLLECCDRTLATLRNAGASDATVRAEIRELVLCASRYRTHETTATHEAVAVDLGSG